jgi:hypothetical protein
MSKYKKIFLVVVLIAVTAMFNVKVANAQQNPVPYNMSIGTAKDTLTFGLSASRILTIENCGTQAIDTIYVYTQLQSASFNTTPFTIPKNQKGRFEFIGNKVILKASRNSITIKYFLGDYYYSNNVINFSGSLISADTVAAHRAELNAIIDSLHNHDLRIDRNDTARTNHLTRLASLDTSKVNFRTEINALNDTVKNDLAMIKTKQDTNWILSHIAAFLGTKRDTSSHLDLSSKQDTNWVLSHIAAFLATKPDTSVTSKLSDTDVVFRKEIDTLKGKFTQTYSTPVEITYAENETTIDCSKSNNFYYNLSTDEYRLYINKIVDGQVINIAITNDSTWVVNWAIWDGTIIWTGGTSPTQTTGTYLVSHTDLYTFIRFGSKTYGTVIQNY